VNPTTISLLLDLNRQFYQNFAIPFSATRHRLQPGVLSILDLISPTANLLDLGCGNGELAHELARCGHAGSYTGLDFSPSLLAEAKVDQPADFHFHLADLSSADWNTPLMGQQFDFVLAFAVLHHLPGADLRLQILHKVRSLLPQGGRFVHSEWQFLNSPRLAARVQPWQIIGLTDNDVDPGDYLLDWRQGGTGFRYVHHFSEPELEQLAAASGFTILESFLSDGENNRLGMYQLWTPIPQVYP
jgi:tRNA (uracil-5-)-methyltransferase TRM9